MKPGQTDGWWHLFDSLTTDGNMSRANGHFISKTDVLVAGLLLSPAGEARAGVACCRAAACCLLPGSPIAIEEAGRRLTEGD